MRAHGRELERLSDAQLEEMIPPGARARLIQAWRILVGEDAKMIGAAVRAKPDASYDYAELYKDVNTGGVSPLSPARGEPGRGVPRLQ
jgi:hypothetical protein